MNDDIEPVAWAIFRDGELDWEHELPFSDEPQAMSDDEESRPLYGGEVIEQLRADAERYRWLRDQPLNGSEETAPYISAAENDNKHWALTGAIADEVIDAAMKEQK